MQSAGWAISWRNLLGRGWLGRERATQLRFFWDGGLNTQVRLKQQIDAGDFQLVLDPLLVSSASMAAHVNVSHGLAAFARQLRSQLLERKIAERFDGITFNLIGGGWIFRRAGGCFGG